MENQHPNTLRWNTMLNWVCDARRVTRVTEQKLTEKKMASTKSPPRSQIWAYICWTLSFPNAFVSTNIHPLSVSRSRRWIQLMNWKTTMRLALLILDFGNKETKLGNHNASRFNLKITELKSIYLANALIFPPCPIIFSWGVQWVYTDLRLVGVTCTDSSGSSPWGFRE